MCRIIEKSLSFDIIIKRSVNSVCKIDNRFMLGQKYHFGAEVQFLKVRLASPICTAVVPLHEIVVDARIILSFLHGYNFSSL